MLIRRVAAVVVLGAALAACGGSSDETLTTLPPTQATDFVVVAVSTTTTTTTTTVPFDPTEPSLPSSATLPVTTQATGDTYTIVGGDSLASIAAKHGTTMDAIVAANGWTDGTSHLLLPGDTIKIRGTGSTTGTGSTGSTNAGGEASGDGCSYTIAAGDNPSSVARKYGVSVSALISANPGGVMDTFLVGAVLQIPSGGNC